MLIELAVLIAAVAVLAKSSSIAVDNAVKLSNFFRISQLTVGVILVAMTTTLPELSVSVVSSSVGEGAIAAGNVFGSVIANILLILGAGAFLYGVKISASNLREIGLLLLLTIVISVYMVFNSTVQQNALGFWEGLSLVCIFGAYGWYMKGVKRVEGDGKYLEVPKADALRAFLVFGACIVLILVSSGFVVDSAVKIARLAGVAESFIGATLIAVGTSLPELSIVLQAVRKKHYGLALGDAIGANVVNLTFVLGIAAIINPIHVTLAVFIAALLFAVIANSLLLYVAAVNRKIGRLAGLAFLALYAAYLIMIFTLQFQELGA